MLFAVAELLVILLARFRAPRAVRITGGKSSVAVADVDKPLGLPPNLPVGLRRSLRSDLDNSRPDRG